MNPLEVVLNKVDTFLISNDIVEPGSQIYQAIGLTGCLIASVITGMQLYSSYKESNTDSIKREIF